MRYKLAVESPRGEALSHQNSERLRRRARWRCGGGSHEEGDGRAGGEGAKVRASGGKGCRYRAMVMAIEKLWHRTHKHTHTYHLCTPVSTSKSKKGVCQTAKAMDSGPSGSEPRVRYAGRSQGRGGRAEASGIGIRKQLA